jgi:uncharacterized protein
MPRFVTITAGGPLLGADLYLPPSADSSRSYPAVITGSGFGGVKEMLLPHFAEALAQAGIATLAIDYAGFGASEGSPRQDLDPRAQIRDLRRGLDFLSTHANVDAARLGVFGPSMCGAHTLVLAGTDPRVRAAVSLVPFVAPPSAPPSPRIALSLLVDTLRRAIRLPSQRIAAAGPPGSHAVMTSDDALRWIQDMAANAPTFRNEVTVRSLARLASYRPMRWVGPQGIRVPLRAILSTSDSITPASAARAALRGIAGLDVVEFSGSHFELFGEHLPAVIRSTVDWFVTHLQPTARATVLEAHTQ